MNFRSATRKDIGAAGESAAAEYLRRRGFTIIDRNVSYKTGELDVVAQRGNTLHFIEVKTVSCEELPVLAERHLHYGPAENLHQYKVHKVARTGEWYAAYKGWEGDMQVDGALVWLRLRDGMARIEYLPQIL